MKKPKKQLPDFYLSELGFEIKKLRIQKKLSLDKLGIEIGLDASNTQKIEAGQNLTIKTLLKICKALDTSPAELFSRIKWNPQVIDIDLLSVQKTIKKPVKKSIKKAKK